MVISSTALPCVLKRQVHINQNFSLILKEVEVEDVVVKVEDVVVEVVVAEVKDRMVTGDLRIAMVTQISDSNLLILNHPTQLAQPKVHQPPLNLPAVQFLKINNVNSNPYITQMQVSRVQI